VTILDVRTPDEYTGRRGNDCDPRQGHVPGARNLDVGHLFEGPGQPAAAERIRELVGLPEGAEIVAYCHSGSRSALATLALRTAGYDARNYAGSWHEWSRHDELPLER
jgi:thiosulfate/3-mercaptopyruvate sulfurtransferase